MWVYYLISAYIFQKTVVICIYQFLKVTVSIHMISNDFTGMFQIIYVLLATIYIDISSSNFQCIMYELLEYFVN